MTMICDFYRRVDGAAKRKDGVPISMIPNKYEGYHANLGITGFWLYSYIIKIQTFASLYPDMFFLQ